MERDANQPPPCSSDSWLFFIHRVFALKYRAEKLDGYRLLLESAGVGLILAFAARAMTYMVALLPGGKLVQAAWSALVPFEYSGAAAGALILGAAIPIVVNRFLPIDRARAWAFDRWMSVPVLITLSNRKFYMGYVMELPTLVLYRPIYPFCQF